MSSTFTFENVFEGTLGNAPVSSAKEVKTAKSRTDLELFLLKTPLMLLEEGSKGVYQQKVIWDSRERPATPTTTGNEFEMVLRFLGITVQAQGSSKKAAKQKAAVAYLEQAVIKGKKDDFFIPGDTVEEALKNLALLAGKCDDSRKVESKSETDEALNNADSSVPTANRIPPEFVNQNWVGKLQEMAQKMKLEVPNYEETVLENKSFSITCSMCKQKTNGRSTTKKGAKNIAAYLMWNTLSKVPMENSFLDDDFEEVEEDENVTKILKEASSEKNKKEALELLLSDKNRFSTFTMDFLCPSINTLGKHHILLEVQITHPISPDVEELQMGAEHTQTAELIRTNAAKEKERKNLPDPSSKVFAGCGSTEEEAIENACYSALIHFNTYKD